MQVLLCGFDDATIDRLSLALQGAGHGVLGATSEGSARSLIAASSPAVVFVPLGETGDAARPWLQELIPDTVAENELKQCLALIPIVICRSITYTAAVKVLSASLGSYMIHGGDRFTKTAALALLMGLAQMQDQVAAEALVREGQQLAADCTGPIRAICDGYMFMPLYQPEGKDGFFLLADS